MRPILFILPLIAVIFSATGLMVSSAETGIDWLAPLLHALGAGLVASWVVADLKGFKDLFARKGARYGASSGVVIVMGVAVIVLIAIVTSKARFNKSYDVTRDGLNTLSDQSAKIVRITQGLDSPISISGYFLNEQIETKFRDLVSMYEAIEINATFTFTDPQINPTKAIADKVAGNVVIFRSKDREQRISVFTEERFTNAIVNVLKEKTKKIYFTTGHGEGSYSNKESEGFSNVGDELTGNKYSLASLSLLEKGSIPEDADMVVIAGPQYDFRAEESRLLESYLKNGGSILIMINALAPIENLNLLTGKFGIQAKSDILLLSSEDPRAQLIGQNNAIITVFDEFSPVSRDFASQSSGRIVTGFTRTLESKEENTYKMKVVMAAKSSNQMMRVKNVTGPDDLGKITEDRVEIGSYPVIAVANGKIAPITAVNDVGTEKDVKLDTPPTGLVGEEARLVVVGSSTFANNTGTADKANRDMFMNITNYLLQDEDFISISPVDATKSTIDITSISSQIILLILAFLYPFLFLGAGTVNWFVRRST
jgi:hypothetical protein